MRAHLDTIPRGDAQGLSCIRLDLSETTSSDELVSKVSAVWQESVQAFWVDTAPWGTQHADALLLELGASPTFGHTTMMARRHVESETWSSLKLEWYGDASRLVAEPIAIDKLAQRARTLPFRPQLSQVLIERPAPENLMPMVLDQLYWALSPTGFGWLYVDPEHRPEARLAVMSAKTPWGLRDAPDEGQVDPASAK